MIQRCSFFKIKKAVNRTFPVKRVHSSTRYKIKGIKNREKWRNDRYLPGIKQSIFKNLNSKIKKKTEFVICEILRVSKLIIEYFYFGLRPFLRFRIHSYALNHKSVNIRLCSVKINPSGCYVTEKYE